MTFRGGVGVLAVAVVSSVFTGPGQTIGVAVFIDHFVASLGLSRPTVSFTYLLGTLTAAAFMPLVGRFIDRRGVRVAQTAIGLIFAVALVNMALVNGAVWLAAGFFGIRLLGQGSLSLTAVVTVQTWYRENRGTAIGIFSTFAGSLMKLWPLALAVVIAAVGWRSAWLVAALAVTLVVVPAAVFGLRSMPTGNLDPTDTVVGTDTDFDRSGAIATRQFWLLAAMTASASMLSTAMNFHQIDLLGSVGISETAAAALFLPQILGAAVASFGFGWAADSLGTRFLPSAATSVLLVTMLVGAVVSPGSSAIVYALFLGAAGGAINSTGAALMPAFFGIRNLGSIQGVTQFVSVAASAIGPWVLALTEASVGYSQSLLLLAALPAAVAAIGLLRLPTLRPSTPPGAPS